MVAPEMGAARHAVQQEASPRNVWMAQHHAYAESGNCRRWYAQTTDDFVLFLNFATISPPRCVIAIDPRLASGRLAPLETRIGQYCRSTPPGRAISRLMAQFLMRSPPLLTYGAFVIRVFDNKGEDEYSGSTLRGKPRDPR